MAWNRAEGEANEKKVNALLDFAKEEGQRIENEVTKRTVDDRVRLVKAQADKAEADSRAVGDTSP
jgi:hypothetical protein